MTFPGASSGTTTYAPIDFILLKPIPPVAVTGADPTTAMPALRLSDTLPPLPATRVRILGANLHERVQVYIFNGYRCREVPHLSDCVLNRDYFEARVTDRAADESWIDVELPEMPERDWGAPWYFGVFDNWTRPGVSGIATLFESSWKISPPIHLTITAEYPNVHGFKFKNEDSPRGLTDFEGVFGNNSRICLGLFGGCICRAPDPVYLLYFAVYEIGLSSASGNCNGMASTSLLFCHRDFVNPSSFTPGSYYAAGLPGSGTFDPRDGKEKSPQPGKYGSYDACEPTTRTTFGRTSR